MRGQERRWEEDPAPKIKRRCGNYINRPNPRRTFIICEMSSGHNIARRAVTDEFEKYC